MIVLNESLLTSKKLFSEYLLFCEMTKDGSRLSEGFFSDAIKKIVDFVKTVSKKLSFKAKEFFIMLKNSEVFKFFQSFKFDYEHLMKLLSAASKAITTFLNPISGLVHLLFPDLIKKASEKLMKAEFMKNVKEKLAQAREWLRNNKGKVILAGAAFAALYILMYLNMSNSGDVAYDFDISELSNIITGKTDFFSWVMDPEALKMFTLFILGTIGIGNAAQTANLVQNTVQLGIALFRMIAEKIGVALKKGRESEKEIEKEAELIA